MKKIKRPTFEEMYDSYKKLIYIETYKHLKPLELIEESMQETMINILKQYEKLADMDEAARRVYIGKIASGTATNFYYKEVAERNNVEYIEQNLFSYQGTFMYLKDIIRGRWWHEIIHKSGVVLQSMNFSRCYGNRNKIFYGFDPNIF